MLINFIANRVLIKTELTKSSKLTSIALWDSLSIKMILWSDNILQEIAMCSNLPSTGTAVLTIGGIVPHLHQKLTWDLKTPHDPKVLTIFKYQIWRFIELDSRISCAFYAMERSFLHHQGYLIVPTR